MYALSADGTATDLNRQPSAELEIDFDDSLSVSTIGTLDRRRTTFAPGTSATIRLASVDEAEPSGSTGVAPSKDLEIPEEVPEQEDDRPRFKAAAAKPDTTAQIGKQPELDPSGTPSLAETDEPEPQGAGKLAKQSEEVAEPVPSSQPRESAIEMHRLLFEEVVPDALDRRVSSMSSNSDKSDGKELLAITDEYLRSRPRERK